MALKKKKRKSKNYSPEALKSAVREVAQDAEGRQNSGV